MKKQRTFVKTISRNRNTDRGTRISTTPCAIYLSFKLNWSLAGVSSEGSVSWRNQIIPVVVLAIRNRTRSAVSLVALLEEIELMTGNLMVRAKIAYWTKRK